MRILDLPGSFWNFVLLACVAPLIECEMFTSMAHLEATLYAERDIASTLRRHVQKERERLNKLEQLADDYAHHSQKALANPSFYLGNPVNAFLLIKRFTLDWDRDVSPMLGNDSWQDLNTELQYARQDLPTTEDLTGTAVALMRLQDTYRLDTSSIARGRLGGAVSSKLTVDECFQLGRLSYNEEDFYHTALWMEEAMNKLGDKESTSDERIELLDYLAFSYYKQGYTKRALTLTNELLELDPDHERAFSNKRYYEDTLVREGVDVKERAEQPAMERQVDEYQQSSEFQTYEALCRGEDTQRIRGTHKLKCRYVHNRHPLLILAPAKEEEMHLDPWVVLYHDVLSDGNIRDIQMMATPRLNRATVQNPNTGILETATYRISKSAWLKATDHPTVAKINQRIQAITGLDIETAEELQIANYGVGGHYEPHYDFAKKEEKDAFQSLGTGNRIATFLNYMSDVEAGGATVFTRLGLKLYPKKGNAAVNIGNSEKQSPLHIAAHETAFDCLRLLVQHGADVNGRDGMGNTPLHVTLAGLAGEEQMEMLLLLLGGRNKAKEETRIQIACFLLLHGTDPGAKNDNGTTALDACPHTHAKVKEALKKFIADNRSNFTTGCRPSNTVGSTYCSLCNIRDAQVLFVPCGHRVMCKKCLSDNSHSACPQCGQSIKQMYDQDGKKISQCIVM